MLQYFEHCQIILFNLFQSGPPVTASEAQEEADEVISNPQSIPYLFEDDGDRLLGDTGSQEANAGQQLEAFRTTSSPRPLSQKFQTPSPTPLAYHGPLTHRRAGFTPQHEALIQGLWGQCVLPVREVRDATAQEGSDILIQLSPKQINDKIRFMLRKGESLIEDKKKKK